MPTRRRTGGNPRAARAADDRDRIGTSRCRSVSTSGVRRCGSRCARVVQTGPEALAVTIEGEAGDRVRTPALVRRMLGADRDLTQFDRAAARVPWLRRLARRMRGVKPPRYPSLWEAFVNTIAFQQVSLHAASAIARRARQCNTSLIHAPLSWRPWRRGTGLFFLPISQHDEQHSSRFWRVERVRNAGRHAHDRAWRRADWCAADREGE